MHGSSRAPHAPGNMKSVCVYCGSNPGLRPDYIRAAEAAGTVIVKRGVTLIYGGGNTGMMGRVADTVLAGGGTVIGVVPKGLFHEDSVHQGLTELRYVNTMHERKALMLELSDALVSLPGGLGTLEEICEVLAWTQLGLHAKPCGLLNVGGYFDAYLEFLDHAVGEGFILQRHRDMLHVAEDMEALLGQFERYRPPAAADTVNSGKL